MPAEFSVVAGQQVVILPTARDPEGASLTFSVSNRPGWLQFSSTTGELRGTPGDADVGTFGNIQITVSDGQAQVTATTSVQVLAAANGRVTLTWTAPTERTDGSPLTDLAGFRIYYGTLVGDLRNVIEITDPGARSWVVENLARGTWYFAATAFDARGNESARTNPVSKGL